MAQVLPPDEVMNRFDFFEKANILVIVNGRWQ